jgi:hypothetical protein
MAQTTLWDGKCTHTTYPNIDKNNGKFPPGSCPPPLDLMSKMTCDDCKKIDTIKASSSKWETGYWHPPEYAFDEYISTRWSSWDGNNVWLIADLGRTMKIKRAYLVWEAAFGESYNLLVSADSSNWTTVKEVRGSDGLVDVVEMDLEGRYLKFVGVKTGTSYGYSLFEFTICAKEMATAMHRNMPMQNVSAPARDWSLVMDARGIPLGIRAYDVMGKAIDVSQGRKLPRANIYIVPAEK